MQAVLGVRVLVAEPVDDLRARVERRLGEPLGAERVEQAAQRLDLLGQHRLGEQVLDLGGDAAGRTLPAP